MIHPTPTPKHRPLASPFQSIFFLALNLLLVLTPFALGQEAVPVSISITDESGRALPCRIHLTNAEGEPQFPEGLAHWADHFVCDGNAEIRLAAGKYRWEAERGPEFGRAAGTFTTTEGASAQLETSLSRIADLYAEGWISGDLHIHRPPAEIPLLMDAEDLRFAPVIEWWNTPASSDSPATSIDFRTATKRLFCLQGGEDERAGGALLYFGLKRPLDLTVRSREYPSPLSFVESARQQDPLVYIDVEKPFWWDTPTWLTTAAPDSVGLAHNHMHRSGVLDNEAWGYARDQSRYPGPHGNGLWSQEIYYHILNCGFRLPPSAGSASGVLPNPVGYNRVYVASRSKEFTRQQWLASLAEGRCWITNGPLLRVTANGQSPGRIFQTDEGIELSLDIRLTSNDPVHAVEVIHNGRVAARIPTRNGKPFADRQRSDTTTPTARTGWFQDETLRTTVRLSEPGWMLVRAIADVPHTFRFASTAPWYLETTGNRRPVRRESVRFFQEWLEARIQQVSSAVDSEAERAAVLRWHYQARQDWMWLQHQASRDQAAPPTTFSQQKKPLLRMLRLLAADSVDLRTPLLQAAAAQSGQALHRALAALTTLEVSVNPEARVKLCSAASRLELKRGEPKRFLMRIDNMAGITAPLRLVAVDVTTVPPQESEWAEFTVVDNPLCSRFLTGKEWEYKLVEVTAKETGIREVRLIGNAGQGTQDLGFRASFDLLLNVR